MSERTAQCQECAKVFDCAPRGVLPKLCPDCKRSSAPRADDAPVKRNGRRKAASNGTASPAIATAIVALQDEIEALESAIASRRTALEALENVA